MGDSLPHDNINHTAQPTSHTSMKDKILKRAELSRITRLLKSRLEIAQFKVERSWQNLPFRSVEPQLEQEAKLNGQRRLDDDDDEDDHTRRDALRIPSSPPVHGDFLVPDLPTRHIEATRRRVMANASAYPVTTASTGADPTFANGHAYVDASSTGALPRISPLKRRRSEAADRDSLDLDSSPLKYRASTPNFKDHDLPTSNITPPPSTPPPSHLRPSDRHQSFKQDAEEGADLLLYLATSPSPAKPRRLTRTLEYSSPPPMRASSAVNTPMGGFNLSEFLNFTPSPAQAQAQAQRLRFDTTHKFSPTKLTYDTNDSPSRNGTRHLDLGLG